MDFINKIKLFLAAGLLVFHPLATAQGSFKWHDYSPAVFNQAQQQNRLILLDLVAVWCHWCHVMDEKTYTDSRVIAEINARFMAVKVDHDARPDLAERYREYGWPATIILSPDGRELHKQAGYIDADDMLQLLKSKKIVDEKRKFSPAIRFSITDRLDSETQKNLMDRHINRYDTENGGLDIAQKFLDEGAILWDFFQYQQDMPAAAMASKRVIQTLDAALQLIDSEFGGVYQYSTGFSWKHPHYEKIMLTQSRYLRLYAKAYELFGHQRYLQASQKVAAYLEDFLSSPQGAFYSSQDADLIPGKKAHDYFAKDRRSRLKLGIPRIDKNQYTAQTAMAMEGLIELYRVSGEDRYLNRVIEALKWVTENRRLRGGGFKHAAQDTAGPFLDDNLYMARTYLKLYEITRDKKWLERCNRVVSFINQNFTQTPAGLLSASDNGTPIKPVVQLDQNIMAADLLIRLGLIEPSPTTATLIKQVMRYLVTPEIALSRHTEAGILYLNAINSEIAKDEIQI